MEKEKFSLAILGLGNTGLSILEFLLFDPQSPLQNQKDNSIFLCDDSPTVFNVAEHYSIKMMSSPLNKEKKININIIGINPSKEADVCQKFLKNSNISVVYSSPGIPYQQKMIHPILAAANQLNIKIVTDIDIFFELNPNATYVGITGTNGKSTVVAMLKAVFDMAVNNSDINPHNYENINKNNNIIDSNVDLEYSKKEINHSDSFSAPSTFDATNFNNIKQDPNNFIFNHLIFENVFLGGNFGEPALNLPRINSPQALYIFELSSYQLDFITKAKFDVVSCLNITPDHLDRYGSMRNYILSKGKIFSLLKKNGLALITEYMLEHLHLIVEKFSEGNGDSIPQQKDGINIFYNKTKNNSTTVKVNIAYCQIIDRKENGNQKENFAQISYFSQSSLNELLNYLKNQGNNISNISNIYVKDDIYIQRSHHKIIAIPEYLMDKMPGKHNMNNFAVVATIAKYFGLQKFSQYAKKFTPLPHRLEFIAEIDGVRYINDSKATNIDAAIKALQMFDAHSVHWIVGGKNKDGDPQIMCDYFCKVKCAYLIGSSSEEFANVFDDKGLTHHSCGTLENALIIARSAAKKGEAVLLSPACASTDQWKNFEERGEAFAKIVKSWCNKED